MKGKFVNICMALLNILLGAIIIIYSLRVPSDITELTVQEYQIINICKILICIVFGITTILNFIHIFLDIRNGSRRTGYIIALFSISFIFVKHYAIAVFAILSGLIILITSIRIRWIETNSYTAISIIAVMALISGVIIAMTFIYEPLGTYILNKENEDELAYKDTYFKYITELEEDNEVYINVKKDGKYGYINSSGETVIDFKYDYASPFVRITAYDKNFCIALVCQDNRSLIIMKNEREVMTYRSESMDGDYTAKLEELEDLYYNTFDQTEEMAYEMEVSNSNSFVTKIEKYDEVSETYTYRYDLNDDYDLLITQSNLGLGDTYELASKDDINVKITLDCENLCYDENYLYIFSNGTIPYYDRSSNQQGWFTSYGRKVTPLTGNAQIIDFFGDYILIKNHNDDTIYFIDTDGKMISETYKEVYVYNEDRFIVKNSDNKYIVINSSFEKVFDREWDFVDTSLLSYGLYVFGTTDGVVEFSDFGYSENLSLIIVDYDGNIVAENVNQVYTTTYEISDDKSTSYSERYSSFLNNLKKMEISYIGDEFYE